MGYFIKAKAKQPTKYDTGRYYNVTRGSGEGGGTRIFSTKRSAQEYAKELTKYNTKIVAVKPKKRSLNNVFSFGSFGNW